MSVTAGEIQFNRGSIEYHLPHTCTILRREQTGTTPYEEPVYGAYAAIAEDVPCRLWIQTGGERTDERRTVLAYEYHLKLAADTDITEDDTVDDVVNQLGEAQNAVPMQVQAVWTRTTEIICTLEKVKP